MDFTKWSPFKSKVEKAHRNATAFVAICLLPNGVALAHSKKNRQGQFVLQRCEFYSSDHLTDLDKVQWLSQIIKDYQFKHCDYSWILLPSDYKLIMLEPSELSGADAKERILWSIKEHIDFPLTDVMVDTCDIPEFGIANKRMIYAVVSEEPALLPSLDLLRTSGISPTIVDITEFALRNLSSLFATENESILLVCMTQYYCTLTLSRDRYLYFSRQIELELEQLDDNYLATQHINVETNPPEAFITLVTDIQSSIRYFEAQMAQSAPTSIVFTPMPFQAKQLEAYLASQFDMTLVFADLNQVMETNHALSLEIQSQCLPVLGGVLRPEGEP